MVKIIEINETNKKIKFKFKYTIKAVMIYQMQFGRGFIEDLQDIFNTLSDNYEDMLPGLLKSIDPKTLKKLHNKKSQNIEELLPIVLDKLDLSKLLNKSLSTEQYINSCQIIWALSKNADNSILEFDDWLDTFEYLPMTMIQDLIILIYQQWSGVSENTIELKKNWAVVKE